VDNLPICFYPLGLLYCPVLENEALSIAIFGLKVPRGGFCPVFSNFFTASLHIVEGRPVQFVGITEKGRRIIYFRWSLFSQPGSKSEDNPYQTLFEVSP
jgi:hypothetical protein